MPLPIETPNRSQEAESVIHHLTMIKRDADYAKSLKAEDVIRLHHQLVRSGAKFTALFNAGLTKEVLGPIISEKLSINWSDYSTEYLQLVETDIPAYIVAVQANQADILQREIVGDTDRYKEIPQATKDILLPLIDNIANALGV